MTEHDIPQQLTLLPSSDVPVQFRLDADTRRRGMQHIAQIRQELARRQADRELVHQLPQRHRNRPRAA
ncbi:MAG: hypothetical protein ABIO83_00155 [Ilumatobacteraceae bacterium]